MILSFRLQNVLIRLNSSAMRNKLLISVLVQFIESSRPTHFGEFSNSNSFIIIRIPATTQLSFCAFNNMISSSDLVVTSSSNTCNNVKLISSTGRIFPCSSISLRRNEREFDMISHINSEILLCFSGSSSVLNRLIMRGIRFCSFNHWK